MNIEGQALLSKMIDFLRFPLIVLVVFIHMRFDTISSLETYIGG